jgi:serine/threonine-protein kinase
VIGSGAMGLVVAATDLELGAVRALKIMLPSALRSREPVARFLREASACGRLRGEHVARVYGVGRLDGGAPFLVMEYLEGSDLGAVLAARGSLPVGEALTIVLEVCEALAEAHRRGIVHRDLKPANLFLARRPGGGACVKVLDFGVAKILGEAASSGDTTRSYVMLGSPSYMSPEQMESSRDVDARADVWSLGVVAYQLLTGRLPFVGEGLTQIVTAVLEGRPAPPSSLVSGLPPALDAAILGCLEGDRARRCAGAVELAASLAPFAPPEAAGSLRRLLGVREPRPRRAPAPARRLPMALLIVGALAFGGLLAVLVLQLR